MGCKILHEYMFIIVTSLFQTEFFLNVYSIRYFTLIQNLVLNKFDLKNLQKKNRLIDINVLIIFGKNFKFYDFFF